MGSIIFGCLSSNVEEKEYPVAASQYFYHEGVNFVYLDGGYVTLALTATATLLGHAHVPAGRGAGTSDAYWLSAAVAGQDKIVVTTDPAAKYLLPCGAAQTPAITDNDLLCDIIAVNDGTATTVDIDTSTTDVLKIVDYNGAKYGGPAKSVVVRINPLKFQGDT